ncbi:MAG: lipoprotein signal peptidase [Tannerella sp.]|jgi:signal peptidase II|nr:lipoprotein signal peptidase [Tannerella sp.]
MQSKSKKAWGTVAVVMLLLIVDQALKIWVKTHMQLHESIPVFSWFQIYFTENAGMAFGMELLDKRILSIFRIVAVIVIAVYIVRLLKHDVKFGYIACIGLIFAGAFGNIIDSVFYGVIFDHSYGQVASFVPQGEGYAPLLYGKVVDMLYFPLIQADLPEWIPIWGGQEFIFFRPIFNLADSAICVGFALLLLFYRKTAVRKLKIRNSPES